MLDIFKMTFLFESQMVIYRMVKHRPNCICTHHILYDINQYLYPAVAKWGDLLLHSGALCWGTPIPGYCFLVSVNLVWKIFLQKYMFQQQKHFNTKRRVEDLVMQKFQFFWYIPLYYIFFDGSIKISKKKN